MNSKRKRPIREILFQLQGGKCCYCQRQMFKLGSTAAERRAATGMTNAQIKKAQLGATLEHLRPTSDGGGNHRDNLALACFRCNSSRGNKNWCQYATEMAPKSSPQLSVAS